MLQAWFFAASTWIPCCCECNYFPVLNVLVSFLSLFMSLTLLVLNYECDGLLVSQNCLKNLNVYWNNVYSKIFDLCKCVRFHFYSTPLGERSIAISFSVCLCVFVCVCVCLSVCEHISGTAGQIFTKFCVQILCGRGSVLLWQCYNTLCTSGFMDDVTFGRNGPYGETWKAELWSDYHERRCDTGTESESINALLISVLSCFVDPDHLKCV